MEARLFVVRRVSKVRTEPVVKCDLHERSAIPMKIAEHDPFDIAWKSKGEDCFDRGVGVVRTPTRLKAFQCSGSVLAVASCVDEMHARGHSEFEEDFLGPGGAKMIRQNGRAAIAVLVVTSFLTLRTSVRAQTQNAPASKQQETSLSPYRKLAESVYDTFQTGDVAAAAKTARSLEVAWDSTSGNIRDRSARTWSNIDEAMDGFIKPIIGYATKAPDSNAVKTAYEHFVSELSEADDPSHVASEEDSRKGLDVINTASGLVCVITKQASGRQPKPGEIVVLRVTGLLPDGKVFRSTRTGDPTWFWLLGDRQPPGVIEGLSLLHVGESAILIIPPGLGYGPSGGHEGAVPPNSMLTYFVQIVDVKSKDMGTTMGETIQTKGLDAAIKEYRDLQREGFPDVFLGQMNSLGYDFLEKGDRETAIRIFELNVEREPQSANAYDSLGEAYAANGQKQLAIENYEKAIAIDPQMQSSVQALKKLKGN
jgi:FKBP-type peptidyl-prolyl cis-trans isomerase